MDLQSVKDYMVADLNVTDANNFEPSGSLTWNVIILKPMAEHTNLAFHFPQIKDDAGYNVTITSTDPSGNTSAPVTRYSQSR